MGLINIKIWLIVSLILVGWLAWVQPVSASASAVIQNDSMWVNPTTSTLHIFGEVRNTGDVWLRSVRVTADLRSVYGGRVDQVSVYASATYLPPGGVAPFDVTVNGTGTGDPYSDMVARVHSYTLAVESQETSPAPIKLTILNVRQSKDSVGHLKLAGEIQNQADTPSASTRLSGTFYDANGKVVYVASTKVSPAEIAPGTKADFQLEVPSGERSGKITHYSLLAESEEYTSVPESPWPASLAVISVSLTALAMRRRRDRLVAALPSAHNRRDTPFLRS